MCGHHDTRPRDEHRCSADGRPRQSTRCAAPLFGALAPLGPSIPRPRSHGVIDGQRGHDAMARGRTRTPLAEADPSRSPNTPHSATTLSQVLRWSHHASGTPRFLHALLLASSATTDNAQRRVVEPVRATQLCASPLRTPVAPTTSRLARHLLVLAAQHITRSSGQPLSHPKRRGDRPHIEATAGLRRSTSASSTMGWFPDKAPRISAPDKPAAVGTADQLLREPSPPLSVLQGNRIPLCPALPLA